MKTLGNSDIGKIRQNNEDAFRFGSFDDGVTWAVVCDGMGGAAGGQIASSMAADMVGRKIEKCYPQSRPPTSRSMTARLPMISSAAWARRSLPP